MAKDAAQYRDFDEICKRLDDIVAVVRDKETSLEKSLDLFDEAIALGSKAVQMVDSTELSEKEELALREQQGAEAEAEAQEKE